MKLNNFNSQQDTNVSEKENDFWYNIFDTIYDEGGVEEIRRMSNFDPINFEMPRNNGEEILSKTYNVGIRKISSVTGKYAFL